MLIMLIYMGILHSVLEYKTGKKNEERKQERKEEERKKK